MNIAAPDYQPLVSIIIPVKNGRQTINNCLWSIRRSYYKNYEVIVVDDHSTDDTLEIARSHPCLVLEAKDQRGANHARNLGTQYAKGEIIVFLDADIVITRETLLTIVESLEEGGADAVVGVYTAKHRHERYISQYKNLWVRYSYIKSPPAIDWLFGAISGIRREAFRRIGGFNVDLKNEQGIEDIELGKRFAQANMNVTLNMDIEVEHLKNYTLRSFIKNEFTRSMGFAELATRLGETEHSLETGFANVYASFVLSTVLSIVLLAAIISNVMGCISSWYLLGAVGIYFLLNIQFLNYLEQVRGLFAMMAMSPFLLLDHIVCFAGSVAGIIKGLIGKPAAGKNSV
jgi:glycosyltransferase involved in cell wall biosynthesis